LHVAGTYPVALACPDNNAGIIRADPCNSFRLDTDGIDSEVSARHFVIARRRFFGLGGPHASSSREVLLKRVLLARGDFII